MPETVSLAARAISRRSANSTGSRTPSARRLHVMARALALLVAVAICSSTGRAAQDNGVILVADPELESAVFARSVVLVIPTENGAALGVIINRPVAVDSSRLFPGDGLLSDAGDIRFGGPVNTSTLVFLFRSEHQPDDAMHVVDDVYMSNSRDLLAKQLLRPKNESGLSLYAGYAGWAPGQLQAELRYGSWTTVKAKADLVFDSDLPSMWRRLASQKLDSWI